MARQSTTAETAEGPPCANTASLNALARSAAAVPYASTARTDTCAETVEEAAYASTESIVNFAGRVG